jgi:hypothetical protein
VSHNDVIVRTSSIASVCVYVCVHVRVRVGVGGMGQYKGLSN